MLEATLLDALDYAASISTKVMVKAGAIVDVD